MFLSATLLASGMYSNQIFVLAQQTNEAEVNADIEQENKCKKDTECEDENEINNLLNITTITQTQQQEQQETPTCETCFTDNLTPQEIIDLSNVIYGGNPIPTLEEICQVINENIQDEDFRGELSGILFGFADLDPTVTPDDINNILDCLEGVFGVNIPRVT